MKNTTDSKNGLLECNVLAVEEDSTVHMLLKLKAHAPAEEAPRPPLHVCMVLDRSSSMGGEKLMNVKAAAELVVRRLSPTDTISIVTFSDIVQTLVPPQRPLTKDEIIHAINGIQAQGLTNLSGGLFRGVELMLQAQQDNGINRLLLLTDGEANRGVTDPNTLVGTVRSAKDDAQIITTAFGFGEGFNEDLLSEMARHATGNFYFIERSDDATDVFAEELGDLQSLAAQNISVKLTPSNLDQEIEQVTGHLEQRHGRELFFELGDAYAEEEKRLLLRLSVPGLEDLGPAKAGDLCVSFAELVNGAAVMKSIKQELFINVPTEEQAGKDGQRIEVLQEMAMQESVKARREAIAEADAGNLVGASAKLQDAADLLADLPGNLHSEVVDQEIDALRSQATRMQNAVPEETGHLRKQLFTDTTTISMSQYMKTNTMRMRRDLGESSWERNVRVPGTRPRRQPPQRPTAPEPGPLARCRTPIQRRLGKPCAKVVEHSLPTASLDHDRQDIALRCILLVGVVVFLAGVGLLGLSLFWHLPIPGIWPGALAAIGIVLTAISLLPMVLDPKND